MTRVFAPDGRSEPATLLQVLPSTIVQFLEFGKAVVAYDDPLHSHRFVRRSALGVLQRVGSSSSSTTSGGGSTSGSSSRSSGSSTLAAVYAQPAAEFVLGQILDVSCLLGATHVTIQGPPKKKGFEGVMQRHGFKGNTAAALRQQQQQQHQLRRAPLLTGQNTTGAPALWEQGLILGECCQGRGWREEILRRAAL
ncbi:hypothetical protein Emed_003776 [Eimeria media]